MTNAFLYLQLTTFKTSLVQRFRRLKQPKYLAGAIAGAAYFYFVFFRHVLRGATRGDLTPSALPPELAPYLVSLGALVLFIIVVLVWVVPTGRAALQFSEAEVAFLFPAPVTRRRLIHFKLLRSQLAILISTFFLSLIFRRASYLGGNPLTHAVGWWIILSTLSLHFLGASFAREQLLDLGLHPGRRRAVALGILALLLAGSWWWIRRHVAPPSPGDLAGLPAIAGYFGGILQHFPIGWILAPFALVAAPYFAPGPGAFLLALGPALLVMGAHYWWVMRADVSFEEASIDQARRHAEKVAAVRSGDWRAGRQRPAKSRPAPFPLAPTGPIAVAFLWKNLVALGPFFRLRTWLIFALLITIFHFWAATGLNREIYVLVGILALSFGAWLLISGPMFMRGDLRLMVSHFDLLKSYPLHGWQVVLGSLLPAMVLLAAGEWLLLLLGAPAIGSAQKGFMLVAGTLGTGSLGIALVLPPLAGLMLSIPFAATLYFPAWAESSRQRGGGGIEAMGQRMIFFAAYIVVLAVALLPAVLAGGLAAFIAYELVNLVTAILAAAVVASVIVGAEFAAAVWWLGQRFDHFDLSREMPR